MGNRKIDDLLDLDHHRFSTLQSLLKQADNQSASTAEVRALLPESIRKACRVIDSTPPTLKIACRNASVATRLRFLETELLEQLSSLPQYAQISKLSVRVVEA